MLIFKEKAPLESFLAEWHHQKKNIGFIPTMGALHQGHLSLISTSLKENDLTVVSIFVNPTQFNNSEDLEKYPRNLDSDIEKIKTLSEKVVLFAPSTKDMYGNSVTSQSFNYDGLELELEGKHRPGHFDGVGTIVKRLFEIVSPTRAYFGEKDFQQVQIVKKLVQKEKLPVIIVTCPVYREPNGLAMSSRNERLTAHEREEAKIIYKTLLKVKERFLTDNFEDIKNMVHSSFSDHPLFSLEYFEITDEETLLPIDSNIENKKKYRAFIAVLANNIRLIDTISLN